MSSDPPLPIPRRKRLSHGSLSLSPAGLTPRHASPLSAGPLSAGPLNRGFASPRRSSAGSIAAPAEENEYWGEWKGRRIRKAGVGSWPCDSIELERHEAQHWLLRIYPFLGPVYETLRHPRQPSRILDIATGTGIWAIDMAELFPYVEVLGIDNVPMQQPMVPGNCDARELKSRVDLDSYPLPYESSSFSLIHLRFAHLRVRSFSSLLTDAIRLLRPGGLLLIFDASSTPTLADGSIPTGVQAWSDAFSRGLRRAGMKPFDLAKVLKEGCLGGMELKGDEMRVPIGHGIGRMGQLGKIHMINTKAYLEAARHVIMEYGGYTEAEVDVLSVAYMSDVEKQPMYTQYHALSVRKPG